MVAKPDTSVIRYLSDRSVIRPQGIWIRPVTRLKTEMTEPVRIRAIPLCCRKGRRKNPTRPAMTARAICKPASARKRLSAIRTRAGKIDLVSCWLRGRRKLRRLLWETPITARAIEP